jgi:hemerythrin-like domain-containing protein
MIGSGNGSGDHDPRRAFLATAGAGAILALSGCASRSANAQPAAAPTPEREQEDEAEDEVTASEDLMREHGVLDRLLLVYEASRSGLAAEGAFDAAPLHRAAGIVQTFIEQYHEKLEEEHLFPRFEKAGRHVELVSVLRKQHAAGRDVTDFVLAQSAATPSDQKALSRAIDAFVRMYRPHAAREDTVLFPALHEIASPAELAELGESFEQVEHQHFGAAGFSGVVTEVSEIEKALGIHDLAQFTPSS